MIRAGSTPVHRLDTKSMRIDPVQTRGEAPGWIYNHRAGLTPAGDICIFGGQVITRSGEKESYSDNQKSFLFDPKTSTWRVLA